MASDVDVLVAGAKSLGIALSREQVAQFKQYQELLLEWNERMNLTAVRDPEAIQARHFVDSLACSLATGDFNGQLLIDVGSGAGFPGLPLKIIYPDLRLRLLESVGKKRDFLQTAIDALCLADAQVMGGRAEDAGQNRVQREAYDWAVARAVARLGTLVEYLLPLVRVGGYVLAQKGRQAAVELGEAEKGIALLGGGVPQLIPLQLAGQAEPSYLVLIEKIKPTPDQYPRRAGVPAKRPL